MKNIKEWFVILVTGSRSVDLSSVQIVKDRLFQYSSKEEIILVNGYCQHPIYQHLRFSVDQLARELWFWSQIIDVPIYKNEGKERNFRMVQICLAFQNAGASVIVEGFPPKGRVRSGTRNCLRFAKEAGLKEIFETEVF